MIARIVLGSISPCLRFSALPPIIRDFASQFVTCTVSGYSTNFMFALNDCAFSNDYLKMRESRSSKMYFALCHPSDIRDLSVEQLQYIPKIVLLRVYGELHRTHLRQASGTREGRFGGSNLSSLRRALQSAVAADAHRRPRTEDKGL